MEYVWWGEWGRCLQRGNSLREGSEKSEHSMSYKIGQDHSMQGKTEDWSSNAPSCNLREIFLEGEGYFLVYVVNL